MFVVIMGDLKRNTEEDKQQVFDLLEELKTTYSDLTIVSGACKDGIGNFVRTRCIADPKKLEFSFVEIDIRVWAKLAPATLSKVYMSRNPALTYIGEVFHIFPYGGDVGHIPDLINMVKAANLPLVVHHRIGKIESFNAIEKSESKKNSETVISNTLKDQLE
jgi:hypothetical protein